MGVTIYKASAGAGKTFQLAREYLLLMFNPDTHFSQILAVTFTNKATAEMAERILSELNVLAKGLPSAHAEALKEEFSLSDEELLKQANLNLNTLLHNYTRFNISTIDSFFQGILKSFTREVGLNVGFNVELNQGQVVEDSVALMFDHFHENKALQKWLVNYSKHNLESGKTWDIQRQLVRFASEALGEVFLSLNQEQLGRLADFSSFEKYKKGLLNVIYSFEKELNQLGENALNDIQRAGLSVDDFSYKNSGPAGYLVKLKSIRYYEIKDVPGKRFISAALADDNSSGWVAKKSSKFDTVQDCVQGGLKQGAQDVLQLFEDKSAKFFTAQVIMAQIDSYAILVEIFKKLIDYCNEKNIFLLSMASPLLSKMIGEDDATFIYEKTGESLQHFMIDEFQDTSNIQWKNFSPLFYNGISQGHKSLVVGDIKQSIYRWRNGDWSLLDSKVKAQFHGYDVAEETLPFNWRSDGRVIYFNNWLFTTGSEFLAAEMGKELDESLLSQEQKDTFKRIYSGAVQEIPNKQKETKGYVRVQFFDDKSEDEDDLVLEQLLASLHALNEQGYSGKDVAIIVRRNTEGAKIAQFLMEQMQQYPEQKDLLRFISNDSVFLESSTAIVLLVSLLKFINDPKDKLARAEVIKLYFQLNDDANKSIKRMAKVSLLDDEAFFENLPNEFGVNFEHIIRLPLVDLVDQLIKLFFSTNEVIVREKAFLDTFQDYVLDLGVKKNHDLAMFLSWWEEGGHRKPISLSEKQDAIRIMTIHKSKGLEFKAVIIPYVDWDFEQRSKILWCKPEGEPFNSMDIVPIAYGSMLKNTQFAKAYYQEQQLAWIDNFNLLYVALTRAEKALYLFAPLPPKSGKMNGVGTLLHSLLQNDTSRNRLGLSDADWQGENLCFELGELSKNDAEKVGSIDGVGKPYQRKLNGIQGVGIRKHAMEYFAQEDRLEKATEGLFMHKVFEQITYLKDIQKVVRDFVAAGLIVKEKQEEVQSFIINAIRKAGVEKWFSDSVNVYNERSLIQSNKEVKRPDRIMFIGDEIIIVDYKFTAKQSNVHQKQVKAYANLLSSIEGLPVKGFVWYVGQYQLVEC